MFRFRRSLLFLAMVGAAVAQTESQIESDEVKRVGIHLKCQCGCSDDVNCNMSSGQCHFCKPARTKIFQMQKAGIDDSGIIASFVKEYGQSIYLADPNSYFWAIPYVSLAFGAVVVWYVLRKMRKPVAATTEADTAYAHYRGQVENETDKLE